MGMALLHILPAAISSLFRFSSYIFLRIIPTSLAPLVLPVLYFLHLFLLRFCPLPLPKVQEKPSPGIHKTRQQSLVASLLFSLKTRDSLPNVLNVAVNTLLFAACLDLALNPLLFPETDVAFARVGAVYPDAAKITVRFPYGNSTEQEIRLLYREAHSTLTGWKDGPIISVQEQDDWVATAKLDNLWPETVYEYAFSDLNRTLLPHPPQQFQTFPDPRLNLGTHFKFLVSSCITPNFPYQGPHERLTIKGFDLLANHLKPTDVLLANAAETTSTATADNLEGEQNVTMSSEEQTAAVESEPSLESTLPSLYKFMLFLGDFVYADVPIYFGDNPPAYLRLYRRVYASPSFRKVLSRLPILFAYDDHEFINNYVGEDADLPPYANAMRSFNLYNGDSNYDPVGANTHYYNFTYGDAAFFVLDTRRHRSNIQTTESKARTMLGSAQLESLTQWLAKVNQTSTFKFIVTSAPFTSLWSGDAVTDSWAGFEAEKARILTNVHSVPNVVFLSGDRHEFAAIEYPAPDHTLHAVREFSASPLNMFYIPFVRTLKMESEEVIEVVRNETRLTDAGPVVEVIREYVPKERVLQYLPVGNSKWSSIEIDTRNKSRPLMRLELVIDGKPAYHLETIGTPVNKHTSKAIISVPSGIKHLFGKLGFQSKQWF